jgi:TfoX/Sxy family transcriptional regulator of competence genes
MAYDEGLAKRFRQTLRGTAHISEKRMMGGICFFLNGNMIGGADRTKAGDGRFMFRVGKENEAEALSRPGASVVEQGGKRLGGLIFVEEDACDVAALERWVALALDFVAKLPPK